MIHASTTTVTVVSGIFALHAAGHCAPQCHGCSRRARHKSRHRCHSVTEQLRHSGAKWEAALAIYADTHRFFKPDIIMAGVLQTLLNLFLLCPIRTVEC